MLVQVSPKVTITFDENGKEEKEEYSLEEVPTEKTKIVQERMNEVLKNIQLDKLVRSLDQCANWIYTAYLGTAGYSKIQSDLLILHDDFGKTVADTDVQLTNFKQQSKKVIGQIKMAGTAILEKDVETACDMLSDCSTIAGDLKTRAENLAKAYNTLQQKGIKIVTAIIEQKDIAETDREKLKKLKEDLINQQEDAENMKVTLEQQTNTIQAQFELTSAEAADASNKAFGLALTSTILSGVSAGIGAGVQALNPMSNVGKSLAQRVVAADVSSAEDTSGADLMKKINEKEAEKKTAESKVEEKRKELTKADEEVQRENVFLEKAKEALAKLKSEPSGVAEQLINTAEEKVQVFLDKVANVQGKKDQVLEIFNKVKQELENILTDFNKLNATLDKLSQKTSQMSESYQQLASSLRQEKMKYFDMLMKNQKAEAENLNNLRKVALRIESTSEEQWDLQTAIQALYVSIGAMKTVGVILNKITEFWNRMSNLCANLADPGVQKKLKAIGEKPDKTYFKYVENMKEDVVRIYAGWKAIEIISHKYAEESAKVRQKVLHDFQENLTTKQSREKAIAMSKSLVRDVNADLADIDKSLLEIKSEQAALEA